MIQSLQCIEVLANNSAFCLTATGNWHAM